MRFGSLATATDAKAITYEQATLRPVRCSGISLGTLHLGGTTPVIYVVDQHAHVPTTDIAAVVGNGLITNRVLTLDFPKSTLSISDVP